MVWRAAIVARLGHGTFAREVAVLAAAVAYVGSGACVEGGRVEAGGGAGEEAGCMWDAGWSAGGGAAGDGGCARQGCAELAEEGGRHCCCSGM